jgi:hypothetical protein
MCWRREEIGGLQGLRPAPATGAISRAVGSPQVGLGWPFRAVDLPGSRPASWIVPFTPARQLDRLAHLCYIGCQSPAACNPHPACRHVTTIDACTAARAPIPAPYHRAAGPDDRRWFFPKTSTGARLPSVTRP